LIIIVAALPVLFAESSSRLILGSYIFAQTGVDTGLLTRPKQETAEPPLKAAVERAGKLPEDDGLTIPPHAPFKEGQHLPQGL
jgi:hypothetical protein